MKIKNILCFVLFLSMFACKRTEQVALLDPIAFDTIIDNKKVALYTLRSGHGLTMQVTNFGGRVVTLWVPDKNGKSEDVVLGHKTLEEYIHPQGERYLGPVVGRYANRIAKGRFELDGQSYQLPLNNNGQTLHGGIKGLDMVVWSVDSVSDDRIVMSYTSPDGSDGFPGNLSIRMTYTLTAQNEFEIEYSATTDKPTVVNLSHHGLFNLKGEGNGTILDHILTINANQITPIDSVLIPFGNLQPVDNTPFDFRVPTAIGERINTQDAQLKNSTGYDHNWVLTRKTENSVELVASLYEPVSGRLMEVYTDQPGLQFYSGNFLDGKVIGKHGKTQNYREAIALETQKFPDSPNHPNFPSTRLNPGETYKQICIYKFSIK